MSRAAKITLGLLALLMGGIIIANAAPSIINSITFGSNYPIKLQDPTPAIGWLPKTDSVLVTLAPSGLSWSNVDKRDSHCTLPTGTIDGGDYITNCAGNVVLVWIPSNSVLYEGYFP